MPALQLRPRASAAQRSAGGDRALLGPPGPWAQCSPWPRGGSTARAALSSAGATTRIPAPPRGCYPETHHPKALRPLRTLSLSPLMELPPKAGGARSGPRVGGVRVPTSQVHGVSLPPPYVAPRTPPSGRQSGVRGLPLGLSSTPSLVSPKPWVLRRRLRGASPPYPPAGSSHPVLGAGRGPRQSVSTQTPTSAGCT